MSSSSQNSVVSGLVNKIKSLITTHNSNSTAHSDIRTTISGKADSKHTHTTSDITDFPSTILPKHENGHLIFE